MQTINYAKDSITKNTEKVKFKCNIDERKHSLKYPSELKNKEETKIYTGIVTNALKANPTETTLKKLVNYIAQGRTFTAGHIVIEPTGRNKNGYNTYFEYDEQGNIKYDEKGKPLQVKFSETGFKSIQLFCVDIDGSETIKSLDDIFRISTDNSLKPCLIYPSFSYAPDNLRYRVAFLSPIEYTDIGQAHHIINKLIDIFKSDPKCKNLNRLYYGTRKDLCNASNFYCDDEIFTDFTPLLADYDPSAEPKKESKKKCECNHDTQSHDVQATYNEHITAFIHQDKETLKELLKGIQPDFNAFSDDVKSGVIVNDGQITVTNKSILSNLFSYYPLYKILGIEDGEKIPCFLHHDKDPSAQVERFADGKYKFKCWGCMVKGEIKFLLQIAGTLTGLSQYQTKAFLCDILNITVAESDYIVEYKAILDDFIEIVQSPYFFDIYPEYRYIGKRKYDLILLLTHFKANIKEWLKDNKGNPLFTTTTKSLLDILGVKNKNGGTGTDEKRVTGDLVLFHILGIVKKLDEKDLPSDILARAKEIQSKNNRQYMYTHLSFNGLIGEDTFRKGKEGIQLLKERNVKLSILHNTEAMQRNVPELALELFPQHKKEMKENGADRTTLRFRKEGVKYLSSDTLTAIVGKIIAEKVQEQGYFKEKDLKEIPVFMDNERIGQWQVMNQLDKSCNEICMMYGLVRTKAYKHIQDDLSIKIHASSMIWIADKEE